MKMSETHKWSSEMAIQALSERKLPIDYEAASRRQEEILQRAAKMESEYYHNMSKKI
jgi:hypothetical protein